MSAVELDNLDRIAAEVFEGYVVRKDLALKFKGQYPVPTYVGEFLLGRYCASTDEEEIAEGLAIVERQLRERTVRAGEEELYKARAREEGRVRIIDLITARLDSKSDSYFATLPSLRLNDVRIEPELVADNERMLTGGFYAEIELEYDAIVAQEKGGHPFGVASLRAIQLSKRGVLEDLSRGRESFTTEEWKRFLIRSVGLEPDVLSEREQDVLLLRMVPFVERNYNMIELGPRGTGKSHLYQQVSPYSHLVSGGKATVARMFVNNATGQRGLVAQYDVVCFDEVSGVSFDQKDGVNIMKGYMEIGRVLARKGEHPGRRRHRDGRQLRRGRRAPAADRPPLRSHAPRDARRHRLHGPHPRLPPRLGRPQDAGRALHRALRPRQRLPLRVLGPAALREPGLHPPRPRPVRGRPLRPRHHGRPEDRKRPPQAPLPERPQAGHRRRPRVGRQARARGVAAA